MRHDWSPRSSEAILGGLWVANPIKLALMKPSFVPKPDTDMTWADVSAQEVAPSGPYAPGGVLLTGKSASYDAADDRTYLLADDTEIGPGFTDDTAFAVVYDSSGTKPLWSVVDFEGIKEVVNGIFMLDWSSVGLLYVTAV